MADFQSLVAAVAAAGGLSRTTTAQRPAQGRDRPLDAVCVAFAADLPVDGVSMSVLSGTTVREIVGSSDVLADRIEDEQYALGVGPCYDAFARGGPVLVPDVRHREETRWPAFTEAVGQSPVRAIFAFPLRLGGAVVGAVDSYRLTPGLPDASDLRDLLRAVDLLVLALANARGVVVGTGSAVPRAARAGWADFLDALPSERTRVHQATGMVIGQLGGNPEQALARIRAYAFADDRRIIDVAADIVARRLVLPS